MFLTPDFGWIAHVASAEDRPLLTALVANIPAGPIGLAVSGGGDSVALLHLMARAAPHAGWLLQVATVDHRLRPESTEEAAFVAAVCADLDLPHQTLVWDDHPDTGNLSELGSQARYGLLAAWARAAGLMQIALAHTLDDQAECFLMGMSRSAGLDGLTGMRPAFAREGVTFLRPLLAHSRLSLRDHLIRHGHHWHEDPTNENPRYLRARARKAMAALGDLGITAEGLGRTITHLAAVQQQLQQDLARAFAAIGQEVAGALVLDAPGFGALAPEVQRRLLIAAIRWVSGARHAPRADAVARLQAGLRAGQAATLGGARFRFRRTALHITREPRASEGPVPAPAPWDHRWHIDGDLSPGDQIHALGVDGLAACPEWRDTGLTRDQLLVSPSVWRDGALQAAPLARPEMARWQAICTPSFGMFILSH